ncbi:MAG: rRNA maturation RNase YbeY [Fimbriimonadaceae bacterium]
MEPPSSYSVGIVNQSGVRAPSAMLRSAVRAALGQNHAPSGRVSLLLACDDDLRELNRTYRAIDEATDVLSFPADKAWLGNDRDHLGDVAISVPYARRQAQARGVDLATELGYLAIHGALHLVGFDDETDAERAAMAAATNRAALAAGLPTDEGWTSLPGAQEATA